MSQASRGSPATARRPSPAWQDRGYFGAGVMAVLGMVWALLGVVALLGDEYFTYRTNELFVIQGYAPWGWAHLLGGLLALAAGAGILWGGHRWARRTAIVVAGVSAVVNLGFLGASPVWSTIMIALAVVALYALTVHGWELDER
ncbi:MULTISPECIES: DUF7144 family membrane protein [unclassified Geodermatophilus]|uniref:DUF7144 family membrane protein n=1 Tax=unclassified Geodermatophilus TaxID=2637632 RepID=UPI003EF0604D